ncbi:YceD family protein [Brevundimonas sp. TWP2-3-4b2]|uniref:YceD family protein n=1 Tax=Brevundimonas sp. TWP2-3-4b2 TaxID=2804595 RepID=UPI003CFB0030
MTVPNLPYSEPVRLHQVPGGVKRTLEPDAAARARIARALDLASLEAFTAEMNLAPTAAGWRLSGRVRASLAQTCGITLEPLPVEVDAPFALTLAEAVDEDSDEIVITLDDESPDLIEDGQIDLGQYAVEQLALRLDPFPRKPGAEFVQPPEPAEISPFAILKQPRPSDEG